MSALSILASALRILPRVQVSVDKVFTVLMSLFNSLTSFLKRDAENDELIETPYVLAHNNFVNHSSNEVILSGIFGYLDLLRSG
jgi:hypothetical protein